MCMYIHTYAGPLRGGEEEEKVFSWGGGQSLLVLYEYFYTNKN